MHWDIEKVWSYKNCELFMIWSIWKRKVKFDNIKNIEKRTNIPTLGATLKIRYT